jgi:hypothetical protein
MAQLGSSTIFGSLAVSGTAFLQSSLTVSGITTLQNNLVVLTGTISAGNNIVFPNTSLFGIQDMGGTNHIRPRDASNNLHIKAASGGIYLDTDTSTNFRALNGLNTTTYTPSTGAWTTSSNATNAFNIYSSVDESTGGPVLRVRKNTAGAAGAAYDVAIFDGNDAPCIRIAEGLHGGHQVTLGINEGAAGASLATSEAVLRFLTGGTINAAGYAGMNGTLGAQISAGNLYVPGGAYGGISIGETYTNYESWDRQLTLNGTGNARLTVKNDTVRMGVHAHSSWGIASQAGYVGTYTNHPVGFIVNTSTFMVLNTSGNLGIGTSTSISEKLSVVGNIAFGNSEGKCRMQYNSTESSIDFIIN